jgi:endonuclease YncB( thermonuclease family)
VSERRLEPIGRRSPSRRRRERGRLVLVALASLGLGWYLGRATVPGAPGTLAPPTGPVAGAGRLEPGELAGPCAVDRVIDGDTADLRCGAEVERVRLLQVNTPERGRPGYAEAADALRALVAGRDVYLAFERSGVATRGTYGRLLAYLYDADGANLNEQLIRQGFSPYWTRYGPGRFPEAFAEAERDARRHRRGRWR